MDEVARLADHLVLMDAGRVLAAGPLTELLARPDLPLARQDDAGVVIDRPRRRARRAYGLSASPSPAAALWVGETDARVGDRCARACWRATSAWPALRRRRLQTSLCVNVLPVRAGQRAGRPQHRAAAPSPGRRRGAAPTWLLARITRRSCESLATAPGDTLFAQVKGVALM
jgi:molybdate transport system ATP-binding protein